VLDNVAKILLADVRKLVGMMLVLITLDMWTFPEEASKTAGKSRFF